jgi:hypothetical protein
VFKLKLPAAGLTQWTEKVLSDLPSGGANPIGDPLLCSAKGGQPDCATPLAARATSGVEGFLEYVAEFDPSGVEVFLGDIISQAVKFVLGPP